MEYVTLNTGSRMPMLGLGIYALHGKECEHAVLNAIELGYRLFDTAQMYGNEKELGRALQESLVPREELFVTTKLYRPNTSYALAKRAIEMFLRTLGLEYIDLLLIHEPYAEAEDMYRAMEEAHGDGRVKAIGISNFNAARYADFVHACNVIPAVNQVEAHIFFQQTAMQSTMQRRGTCMQAWSPLAAGKNDFFGNSVLQSIGNAYGKSSAQVGLKFLVQRGFSVIPKSSQRERMQENMDIFDFQLSEEDMRRIVALDQGKTLFGWY